MRIDGGCHCGNLSYEAEIEPAKVGVCSLFVPVPKEAFNLRRSALPWVMDLGTVKQVPRQL